MTSGNVTSLRRGITCTHKRPAPVGQRRQPCGRPAVFAFAVHPSMHEQLAGIGGFACEACACELRDRASDPSVTTTVEVARLTAGTLAALADAVPRCNMLPCVAAVARWGQTCQACGVRVLALADSIGALDEVLASNGGAS